jgi:hypothetical protein
MRHGVRGMKKRKWRKDRGGYAYFHAVDELGVNRGPPLVLHGPGPVSERGRRKRKCGGHLD